MLECRSTGLLCSLEYLAAAMVELSNAYQLVIRNVEELNKLVFGETIAEGGVLPNVEAVLLSKKTQEEVGSKDRLID
eukprot:TsM_000436300 transcript=TsM_000436300 gene=TsM_000436300